jgi:hypothetical protein
MEFEFILTCIMGFISIFIIGYFYTHKNNSNEVLDWNSMQLLFFQNIKFRCKAYKLLDINTPMDLMMIESLFLSNKIPYHISFRYFMGIWPFVQAWNYNNCEFYILEKDYADSIIIMKNYIKIKQLENYSGKDQIRNILEIVIGGWVTYDPKEVLGISLYTRKNKIKKYIPEYFVKMKKKK